MRKIWLSSKTPPRSWLSRCADFRSVPNGFSMMMRRHPPLSARARPDCPSWQAIAQGSARRIDMVQSLSQAPEALRIVGVALNEGCSLDQPPDDRFIDGSNAEFTQ